MAQEAVGVSMDEWIRGKQIMVVDDESDLTEFYKISLEHYGFVVDTFNEPKEALSSFESNYYDLIILDIKMPNMKYNHTDHLQVES